MRKPWRSSSRATSPLRNTRYASTFRPMRERALCATPPEAPRRCASAGIVEHQPMPRHAAQLRQRSAPVRHVHQHAQADRRRRTTRSGNASACASPSANSIESPASAARARATLSISREASTPVTMRAPLRERQRRAPGAGCHVEHAAAGYVAEKLGEHPLLIVRAASCRSARQTASRRSSPPSPGRRTPNSCSDSLFVRSDPIQATSAAQASRVRCR